MTNAIHLTLFALLLSCFATPGSRWLANSKTASLAQSPGQSESIQLNAKIDELYKQGRYDEALPLAKRVVEIEQASGVETLNLAIALANLAELYFAKKDDSKAEKLFQQALAIYDKHQVRIAAVSSVLERLAQFNFHRRDYDGATALLERAVAIREQSFGAESIPVAEVLHELANVYQVRHRSDRADPLYLRSITIKEKILGRTHPNTVQAMKDYACLRVKDKPIIPGTDEIEPDLSESEIEKESIRVRASCWLYGYDKDCDKHFYRPPENRSTILNGKALKLAQPPYPLAARQKHLSGRVYVAINIDETGNVIAAKPVCGGYSELNSAGLDAARASKFSPTIREGQPVRVQGLIIYNFVAY